MKKWVLFLILLVAYLALLNPFTSYLREKPVVEKLGYVPQAGVLKVFAADQQEFTAAMLVMKVLFYFGTLVEEFQKKVNIPPDYEGMYRTIDAAVRLDPCNMDGYYFAQAMIWDAHRVAHANALLEYGMQCRDWDFYLPFFAGFNYSYFLKDYEKAAHYYRRAAELSGAELFANLAGRYMYEAGQTEHAIAYLSAMKTTARNDSIRKTFEIRLRGLQEVRRVEQARDRYLSDFGKMPFSIEELVKSGLLKEPPIDPYGGSFYFDESGKVRSTSQLATGGIKKTKGRGSAR